MENKNLIKIQVIKSITAFVCVIALCITGVTAADKLSKMTSVSANSSSSSSNASADSGTDAQNDTPQTDVNGAEETTAPAENATDAGGISTDSGSSSSQSSGNNKSNNTTTAKASNGVPATKAEIVSYCNNALNKAKAAKVGYDKNFVRKGGDNLPSVVSSLIKADKKTTMKKGSADIKDDFPAAGFDWSSKLRESDVASATLKQNGQNYEILLKLGKETNPGKGEASSYGRVMSVIDANDAKDMLPGIKSINFSYHDGYVKAVIDSKTGKLVSAEFSASADLEASIAVLGDLKATNIVSTETFTNIVW